MLTLRPPSDRLSGASDLRQHHRNDQRRRSAEKMARPNMAARSGTAEDARCRTGRSSVGRPRPQRRCGVEVRPVAEASLAEPALAAQAGGKARILEAATSPLEQLLAGASASPFSFCRSWQTTGWLGIEALENENPQRFRMLSVCSRKAETTAHVLPLIGSVRQAGAFEDFPRRV